MIRVPAAGIAIRMIAMFGAMMFTTGPGIAQQSAAKSAKGSAESAPRVQSGDSAKKRVPFDSTLEARTTRVASQLRCPVCQGLSIQDSPSELAQQMRALVREKLASGLNDEQVRAFFIERYGEWILLKPKATGFNLLIYFLPLLALAVGATIIFVVVRKWTAGGPAFDPSHTGDMDGA